MLRLRSFTVSKRLAEDEILRPNVQERMAELIGILVPFVSFSLSGSRPIIGLSTSNFRIPWSAVSHISTMPPYHSEGRESFFVYPHSPCGDTWGIRKAHRCRRVTPSHAEVTVAVKRRTFRRMGRIADPTCIEFIIVFFDARYRTNVLVG